MLRVTVCLVLIAIILNEYQTLAETDTATAKDAAEDKKDTNASSESKADSDKIIDNPNKDSEIAARSKTDDKDKPADNPTTDAESKENSKAMETTNKSDKATKKSDEELKTARDAYKDVQDINDIIEAILNQSAKLRNKAIQRQSDKEDPNYLGKFTGHLVVPALKAHQLINKGFEKTGDGLKRAGSGTFEAAQGVYNFLQDAAGVVWNG